MSEAEIIVHETVPTVTIIREFDAPVEKVFGARFDHFDRRTGGAYRITMWGEEMQGSVHAPSPASLSRCMSALETANGATPAGSSE